MPSRVSRFYRAYPRISLLKRLRRLARRSRKLFITSQMLLFHNAAKTRGSGLLFLPHMILQSIGIIRLDAISQQTRISRRLDGFHRFMQVYQGNGADRHFAFERRKFLIRTRENAIKKVGRSRLSEPPISPSQSEWSCARYGTSPS